MFSVDDIQKMISMGFTPEQIEKLAEAPPAPVPKGDPTPEPDVWDEINTAMFGGGDK